MTLDDLENRLESVGNLMIESHKEFAASIAKITKEALDAGIPSERVEVSLAYQEKRIVKAGEALGK